MKDSWKSIAVGAMSCVTLMVGFWLVEARNYVSRAEASAMIQTESPYIVDQQLVLQSLDNLNRQLETNNRLITDLNLELARLRAEIDKLDKGD